jgi:tetratricopeptide (TPR) repeat protein
MISANEAPKLSEKDGPAPTPQVIGQLMQRFNARQYGAAESMARQLTQQFPQHAFGWKMLGASLRELNRRAEALEPMQVVTLLAPSDPLGHFNLGNTLRNLGRLEDALAAYQRALELKSDYAKAHYGLGNTLNELGQGERAIASYQRALDIEPGFADACLNLGNALLEFGLYAQAQSSYLHAQQLKPKWSAPHFNLHALLLGTGDFPGAIQSLNNSVDLEPNEISYRWFLGALLEYTGDAESAQLHFAKVEKGGGLHRARIDAWRYMRSAVSNQKPVLMTGTAIQTFQFALDASNSEGLVLEFGVRYGKSIRQIATLIDSPVHGFDSFEGLPEHWHREPKGSYSTKGQLPQVPANVALHVGMFENTLPLFLANHPERVRFVNIDCDIYSSTKTVLDLLAHRIGPGAVIVFDEYIGNEFWRQDEFKAFQEAVAGYGWTYEYLCFSLATKQVAVRILSVF